MSSAERRAIARENAAKKKAAERYKEQAKTLQKQADALKTALSGGYKEALDKRLGSIDLIRQQQDATLLGGYQHRVGSLEGAKSDSDKAEADSSFSNLTNRARERGNAMSEAMLQGAGESDVMRTQLMSLRNWNANQSEISRSYFDGLRSINSSLTDLNVDTKTGRLNVESQANSDASQSWTQYYNQMADSWTQLGNIFAILGLRALYFLLADLANRFHLLAYGLALVLVFIGGKMLLIDLVKIPIGYALLVTATLIAGSIVLSLRASSGAARASQEVPAKQ